jgi:hypothetical protein
LPGLDCLVPQQLVQVVAMIPKFLRCLPSCHQSARERSVTAQPSPGATTTRIPVLPPG